MGNISARQKRCQCLSHPAHLHKGMHAERCISCASLCGVAKIPEVVRRSYIHKPSGAPLQWDACQDLRPLVVG